MSEIKDGGPAFPTDSEHQSGNSVWHHEGMTLRDYFAAKALPALIAGRSWDHTPESDLMNTWVKGAYELADAMLEARQS